MGFKKTARECLIESIRVLVDRKPLESIAVAEIIELAGVSRAAFYKNFADKYELAQQVFIDELSSMFFFSDEPMELRETSILLKIDEHRQFYRNAIKSQEFIDVWMRHAYDSDYAYLSLKLEGSGVCDPDIRLCAYLITQTLADATFDWIRRRPDRDAREYAHTLAAYCKAGLAGVLESRGYATDSLASF